MKLNFNTIRQPGDLPNREGFRCIGIYEDGGRHVCVVRKNAIGCHSIYNEETGEPCFLKLEGWEKLPKNNS